MAYGTFERIADTMWARRGARRAAARVQPAPRRRSRRQRGRAAACCPEPGCGPTCATGARPSASPAGAASGVVDSIRLVDEHRLADALAPVNGVVIALPHMGNWDHAGAWATLAHSPVVTVAERLKPEDLYEKFVAFRALAGHGRHPAHRRRSALPLPRGPAARGRLVALLGDRDISRSGVPVQFFGAKAKFPAGPAALAVDTGAVLLTASLYWEDGHNWVRFHPPVEVPPEGERSRRIFRTTQLVADQLEEAIAAHPTDWHMLQRLWVDDLDPGKPRGGRP